MCRNITYDYANLGNPDYRLKYTAYAALMDRTSVCQGYAVLLYRLLLTMGIDARVITGYSNGGGHAWNIVKLGRKYYNLDSTWDASWSQVGLAYEHFLRCNDNFPDHIRDSEYDTADFNAAYPMSETDYDPNAADSMDGCAAGFHTAQILPGKAATCTEPGLTEGKKCSLCDAVITPQAVIPAKGHTTSDWVIDTEPAPGVEGSRHKECMECGETLETGVIEALPVETDTETEAPTEAPAASNPNGSDTDPSGKGCSGVVLANSVGVILLAALCSVIAVRRREDEDC